MFLLAILLSKSKQKTKVLSKVKKYSTLAASHDFFLQ